MKAPKNIQQFFFIITLVLSISLFLSALVDGIITGLGISTVILLSFALAFLVAAITLIICSQLKTLKLKSLLKNGFVTRANVTYVKTRKYNLLGRKQPYIIHYEYSYHGIKYEGESEFLWLKPNIYTNDKINIYIDKTSPSISTIDYTGNN